MSRALAREDAFKLIFEMEITKISADDAIKYLYDTVNRTNEMWAQEFINASNRSYIESVVNGVERERGLLIPEISSTLKEWTIERISKVSLSILLLAAYEIHFFEDIPYKVSANEAVKLAKKYAGREETSFINGVLGTIIKSLESETAEEN